MTPDDVRENVEGQRFELHVGPEAAFIQYQRMHDLVVITHTDVPSTLEGMGVGSALAEGTLRLLAEKGAQILPICPFVHEFIRRHPQHADLVSGRYKLKDDLTDS